MLSGGEGFPESVAVGGPYLTAEMWHGSLEIPELLAWNFRNDWSSAVAGWRQERQGWERPTPLQLLQRPACTDALSAAAIAGDLGTSHGSRVGSLKAFSGTSPLRRMYGSEGELAASMPIATGMATSSPFRIQARGVSRRPDPNCKLVSWRGKGACFGVLESEGLMRLCALVFLACVAALLLGFGQWLGAL